MHVHFTSVEAQHLFKMEVPLSTFSHNFGISSICSLITVTGNISKESLLGKKAIEVCVHVYV